MDDPLDVHQYLALALDDASLEKELQALLTARAPGNAYSSDGGFQLPWQRFPRV